MKHLKALLIKFVIVAVVLELTLLALSRLSFGHILIVSLSVTVISYLLGDILILPASNNSVATLSDIALSLLTILLFNWIYKGAGISFMAALIASVIIGVGEWFFHKYMARILESPEHRTET